MKKITLLLIMVTIAHCSDMVISGDSLTDANRFQAFKLGVLCAIGFGVSGWGIGVVISLVRRIR